MPPRPQVVERLVGLFILVPLLLVGVLVFGLTRQKGWFERWITIRAPFPPQTIVTVGAKVTFGGKDIGRVTSVTTDNQRRTIANLHVREGVAREVKTDSTASLVRPNFIGDPVVNISFGTAKGVEVENNGLIAMRIRQPNEPEDVSPESMRELFGNLLQITKKSNGLLDQITQPNSPVQRILAHSDKLLSDVVAAEEQFLTLMKDRKAQEKELADRIASVLGQVCKSIRAAGTPFPIEHRGGQIELKLPPKLEAQVDQLVAMANKLDKLLDASTKGQSTVGLLLTNREFYDRTMDLLSDVKTAIGDMREIMEGLKKLSPDVSALVTSGRTTLERGGRLLKGLESNPFLGGAAPKPRPEPPEDVEQRYNTYDSDKGHPSTPPSNGGK